MTIQQIEYVLEIAKAHSIHLAAKNLYISHSALSSALRNLEKELGHTIFERSARGVELTPFGSTFITYIEPLQKQLNQLTDILNWHNNRRLTIASIGFFFIPAIASRIVAQFGTDYNFQFQQFEESQVGVPEQLVSDRAAEIAIVRYWNCYENEMMASYASQGLEFHPLRKLDVGITVGRKNPLFYSECDEIDPEVLRGYPMIAFPADKTAPFSDVSRYLSLPQDGNRIYTNSRLSIYEFLNESDCYYINSVYNEATLRRLDANAINRRTLKLRNCEVNSIIGWVKRADDALSETARAFVEELEKFPI